MIRIIFFFTFALSAYGQSLPSQEIASLFSKRQIDSLIRETRPVWAWKRLARWEAGISRYELSKITNPIPVEHPIPTGSVFAETVEAPYMFCYIQSSENFLNQVLLNLLGPNIINRLVNPQQLQTLWPKIGIQLDTPFFTNPVSPSGAINTQYIHITMNIQ